MINPYSGQEFFGFFSVLFSRVLKGEIFPLAFDEIQCLVLVLLSFSLSFLGSFLVLRQMTMLANALSHTILLGIVVSFLFVSAFLGVEAGSVSFTSLKVLLIAALITGVLTTFLTELLTHRMKVQEDASIGVVFTTLFALGVLLVTLFTRNMHLGIEAIMGNIDALHMADVKSAGSFAIVSLLFYILFFRGFFVATFDSIFARSIGFPVQKLGYLLMVLTAGGAVASFRAVGVILFLAFLVGPVLIARLYTHSLKKLIALSFCIGSGCSVFSVAFSRHLLTAYGMPISTSALAVTALLVLYVLALLFSGCQKKKSQVVE
jgi:manganese/zinc/iron transport system permease protein